MKTCVLASLLLAAGAVSVLNGKQPTPAQEIIGRWEVVRAERDQKPTTLLNGAVYEFKADRKMFMTPRVENGKSKLPPREAEYRVLPPEKDGGPARLQFKPKEGLNKDEELEGVFRVRDGQLELCHGSIPRSSKGLVPTEFATHKGSGWVLMTLKRVP